jgi:hypothetical protein
LIEHGLIQILPGCRLALVEYCVETLGTPFFCSFGVDPKARGFDALYPGAVIDLHFAGAAFDARTRGELQLTGCVVTAVTNDAAVFQHRLDTALP